MKSRLLFGLIALIFMVTSAIAPFPYSATQVWAGDEGSDDPIFIIGPARVAISHTVWVSNVDALKDKAIWTVTIPEDVYFKALPHAGTLFAKNKVKVERGGKVKADGSIPVKVELEVPLRNKEDTDLKLTVDFPDGGQIVVDAHGKDPLRAKVHYTVAGG
ncbi:MAG: hypothetical protein NTZ05_21220 [Chloroflexi bacterium]|nr:hypothetical protein [Chloroflexota bacterium]